MECKRFFFVAHVCLGKWVGEHAADLRPFTVGRFKVCCYYAMLYDSMIVVTLLEKLFQETVVIIFDGGFREATKVAKTDMFFSPKHGKNSSCCVLLKEQSGKISGVIHSMETGTRYPRLAGKRRVPWSCRRRTSSHTKRKGGLVCTTTQRGALCNYFWFG